MALREVKPLNTAQWKLVTSALKAGPTPEQKKFVADAVARAKQLQESKN